MLGLEGAACLPGGAAGSASPVTRDGQHLWDMKVLEDKGEQVSRVWGVWHWESRLCCGLW